MVPFLFLFFSSWNFWEKDFGEISHLYVAEWTSGLKASAVKGGKTNEPSEVEK